MNRFNTARFAIFCLCAVLLAACQSTPPPPPHQPASLVVLLDKTMDSLSGEVKQRWSATLNKALTSTFSSHQDRFCLGLITENTANNEAYTIQLLLPSCEGMTNAREREDCQRQANKKRTAAQDDAFNAVNKELLSPGNPATSAHSDFWSSLMLASRQFKGVPGAKHLVFFADMEQNMPNGRNFAKRKGLPATQAEAEQWGAADAKAQMDALHLPADLLKGAQVQLNFPYAMNEAQTGRAMMVAYWSKAFQSFGLSPDSLLQ